MPASTQSLHLSGAHPAPMMARELDQLHERLARRLRRQGVHLPDAELRELAESVLADAVRLSLDWLDIEREAAH